MGYFRISCLKNNVLKPATVALIDTFEQKKEPLEVKKESLLEKVDSNISLENQRKFEAFITKYFTRLL